MDNFNKPNVDDDGRHITKNRRFQKLTSNDRSLSTPTKPINSFLKNITSMKSIIESNPSSSASYGTSNLPGGTNAYNYARKHTARRVTDGGQTSGLLLHNFQRRRESFLYKSDSDMETSTTRSSTRNHSITGDDSSTGIPDDIIITPFAQVLSSLKKVRANFLLLCNLDLSQKTDKPTEPNNNEEDPHPSNMVNDVIIQIHDTSTQITKNISLQTLEELEWCLGQLETIHTSQSVSNLTNVKFKKLLSKELNSVNDKSGCNRQVSDYIFKTFLDDEDGSGFNLRSPLFQKQNSTRKESSKIENDFDFVGLTDLDLDFDYLLKIPISSQQKVLIDKFFESHLNTWNLDIFLLNDLTNGQCLTFLSYKIFKFHNFFIEFQIPMEKFIRMVQVLEFKYHPEIPYHNNIHAADVLHTTHVLLNTAALKSVFSPQEIFAILIASIIHDIDHPGYTNQFLINTTDNLALVYNDISVLENHHLAVAFQVFQDHENLLFSTLDQKETRNIRRLIIDMVLATDMSKHMTLLADLKTLVETNKVAGCGVISMENYYERVQVLQVMIHCSDLSNPTKNRTLYQKWVGRIMEEFFRQGDEEKQRHIDVSPMCDRNTSDVANSQVRFIDFIVHPLWETWSDLVYPECQFIMDSLEDNRDFYEAKTITNVEKDNS